MENLNLESTKLNKWNFIPAFLIVSIAFSAIFMSIAKLQIVESAQYEQMAKTNQLLLEFSYPNRGVIFDINGIKVADNVPATDLYLDIEAYTDDQGDILQNLLAKHISIVDKILGDKWIPPVVSVENSTSTITLLEFAKSQIEEAFEEHDDYAYFLEVPIAKSVDNDQTISLKSLKESIPGIVIDENKKRRYPIGQELAHILGYTSTVTAEDLEDSPYLGYNEFVARNSYKDEVGRLGIEKVYDKELIGEKGIVAYETDALGNVVSGLKRSISEKVNGHNITLSIDSKVQKKVYDVIKKSVKEYKATGGAGIIQNIKTGELVSLVSYPSYDNNDFIGGISQKEYSKLLDDDRLPLLNRTISAQLPPGSTFKTLAAVAALDSGAIDTSTVYISQSGYKFSNGAPFQEYHNNSYGALTVTEALSVSSNIFFCEVIRNWDIEELVTYYEKFGIGSVTGVDLVGESAGRLPSPANKIALSKVPGITWLEPVWYPEGDGCNTVIGQGITLVTPLQMSNWIATIVNGGNLLQPKLVTAIGSEKVQPTVLHSNVASDEVLSIVQKGMRDAVAGPRKSIFALTDAKVAVAAKTGTAEFGALNSKGEYEHTHAWVTGFFPYENPEYSFVVLLEDGGESYNSAKTARAIIDWFVQYEPKPISEE